MIKNGGRKPNRMPNRSVSTYAIVHDLQMVPVYPSQAKVRLTNMTKLSENTKYAESIWQNIVKANHSSHATPDIWCYNRVQLICIFLLAWGSILLHVCVVF